MSTSITSMGASSMYRLDTAQLSSSLFSRLDTQNKGYIEKSDLQSALSQTASGNAETSVSTDDIFSRFDGDSDGKITKDEMTSGIEKLAAELDDQFNQMRLNSSSGSNMQGMGGMPPPPASGEASTDTEDSTYIAAADTNGDGTVSAEEAAAYASSLQTQGSDSSSDTDGGIGALLSAISGMNGMQPPPQGTDTGFTKDELSSQLEQIGSSDSKRSNLISKIVDNFDKADTDGDGKISSEEAMTYDKSTQSASAESTSVQESDSRNVMRVIMQLMQSYGAGNETSSQSGLFTATA